MKRPVFFNDMLVFSDDLNYLNSSKEEELNNRFKGFLDSSGGISNGGTPLTSAGILGSPADYLLDKNIRANAVSGGEFIEISVGKALDVNGELINVLTKQTALPDNTATPSVLNYIKIKYAEIASAIQTDDLGNPNYTRYTPSYTVTVDDVAPISPEILLGTFVADSNGWVSGSITDKRLYARLITAASSVYLDPLDKPLDTWTTVEDHINALGSGVVTENNPHGLTASDLGITDISSHNKISHTAGIVALNGIYTSVVFASFAPTATDLGGSSQIAFDIPDGNAGILVGGFVYIDSLPTILLTDTSIFTEGLNNVGYYVYLDHLGEIKASTIAGTEEDPNRFDIIFIYITDNGSDFDESLTADLRKFKSLHQQEIRADQNPGAVSPSITLTAESTLRDNLNHIRWQLGKAINGNGISWAASTYILTDGPTSYADARHTHKNTAFTSHTINSNAVAGFTGDIALRMYRGKPGGLDTHASLYWKGSSTNAFVLYESEESAIHADLYVEELYVHGNTVNFYVPDAIPNYGGISIDLKATSSVDLDGPAFIETPESALNGLSVQPAFVFSNDSGDSWFHLWLNWTGSPSTSTHGSLKVDTINVDGQTINAARVVSWDNKFTNVYIGDGMYTGSLVNNGIEQTPYGFTNNTENTIYLKTIIRLTDAAYAVELDASLKMTGGPDLNEYAVDELRFINVLSTPYHFCKSLTAMVPPGYYVKLMYTFDSSGSGTYTTTFTKA